MCFNILDVTNSNNKTTGIFDLKKANLIENITGTQNYTKSLKK